MSNWLIRCAALPVIACVLLAANIDGKWRADFTTPDGTQRSNTFTFKADGNTLTGAVAGTQDDTPIKNGKIEGDTVTFTADRPFGTFTYKGRISGDEIRFAVQFNENSFEMTAKRLK